MATVKITNTRGEKFSIDLPEIFPEAWASELENTFRDKGEIDEITFEGVTFKEPQACVLFKNVLFRKCTFLKNCFMFCRFDNVICTDCTFSAEETWPKYIGITVYVRGKRIDVNYNDNNKIAGIVKGRVTSLPNDKFVKVMCTCDFCHKTFSRIQPRENPEFFMNPVPNCDKIVCDKCYKDYALYYKDVDHRTYGYRGSLSFYRTPMDKKNTAILGLEMEFEGDFTGWKELEDAHKGTLHYGYDSSVRGKNELSWDCGSYSWWKYLSPLKETCKALKAGGAEEGPTAGIHIHVSRPDVNGTEIAERINMDARESLELRTAMIAVSMRKDLAKMERFASFSRSYTNHHAAISASEHGTTEFRIFASSLDPNIILKRLLLCKTWFNLAASGAREKDLLTRLPQHLKQFILDCAKEQLKDKIITDSDAELLEKTLN